MLPAKAAARARRLLKIKAARPGQKNPRKINSICTYGRCSCTQILWTNPGQYRPAKPALTLPPSTPNRPLKPRLPAHSFAALKNGVWFHTCGVQCGLGLFPSCIFRSRPYAKQRVEKLIGPDR